MQNLIPKFRQSSIAFEKPDILSEKLKTSTSSNYSTVQYFLLKFLTRVLLTNVYKRVCGIFFIIFLELFARIKKDLVSIHLFFTLSLITPDLSKIKKIPQTLLQTLLSRKRVQNVSKNIKHYGSSSSSKFSIFQTKSVVSWE